MSDLSLYQIAHPVLHLDQMGIQLPLPLEPLELVQAVLFEVVPGDLAVHVEVRHFGLLVFLYCRASGWWFHQFRSYRG